MKPSRGEIFNDQRLRPALAAAILLGVAGLIDSAHAATATGMAEATVLSPIAVAASDPGLRFGSFSTTASGQSVSIGTDGARTLSGVLGAGGQSAFGAASLTVTGESALSYAITLPTSVNLTTGAGDAPRTMVVTGFRSNPSGTGALTAGAQTLLVGATLTTVAGQVAGQYTGSFSVQVEYD